MTAALVLEQLIGPYHASVWLNEAVHDVVVADMLDPVVALEWVLRRVEAGDPRILAAPGQVWRLPDGVDPADVGAPARCLWVHQWRAEPPRGRGPVRRPRRRGPGPRRAVGRGHGPARLPARELVVGPVTRRPKPTGPTAAHIDGQMDLLAVLADETAGEHGPEEVSAPTSAGTAPPGPGPTTVVNLRGTKDDPAYADVVYVGRPMFRGGWRLYGHPLASPFKVGRDGDAVSVVAKYRAWLMSRPDLLAQLPALRGRRLGCWCPPGAPCHARVLAELADAATPDADHATPPGDRDGA